MKKMKINSSSNFIKMRFFSKYDEIFTKKFVELKYENNFEAIY
jgi:hypothetical protein